MKRAGIPKLIFVAAMLMVLVPAGCSIGKDESTRMLFSERLALENERSVFFHITLYEKDGGTVYGLGAYDPTEGKTTELLEESTFEKVWISEIASAEERIVYTAFQTAGTHGIGQTMYGIHLNTGERFIIDETNERFRLYETADGILYEREEDESFYMIGESGEAERIPADDERIPKRDYLKAEIRLDNEDVVRVTTAHGSGFFYARNEEEPKEMTCLAGLNLSTSGVYEEWFCAEDSLVTGKVARMDYQNGIIYPESMVQNYVASEYLIEIDPYAGTDRILYETKNNRERIVAYRDRVVYLYKDNALSALHVDTNERENLMDGLPPEDDLTFAWRNGYLIVFDESTYSVVGQWPAT